MEFDLSNVNTPRDPTCTRVRCVARKRYPLAKDLRAKFEQNAIQLPKIESAVTFVGHTRFATSSVNTEPELHPHEWVSFHDEMVWRVNRLTQRMEKSKRMVGIHISHNGDFDELTKRLKKINHRF